MTPIRKMITSFSRPRHMQLSASTRWQTTYSGGQPYDGQGGFYGAIKSRSEQQKATFQPGLCVRHEDLQELQQVMNRWEKIQVQVNDNELSWKTLLKDREGVEALLSRLVVKGAPVWGLTLAQRRFVERFQRQG